MRIEDVKINEVYQYRCSAWDENEVLALVFITHQHIECEELFGGIPLYCPKEICRHHCVGKKGFFDGSNLVPIVGGEEVGS
jgi:hypothetical protein